jgi:hypothetical protein
MLCIGNLLDSGLRRNDGIYFCYTSEEGHERR